jgi:phage terminase large subunit
VATVLKAHATATCCWCQGKLYQWQGAWWCGTPLCRQTQASWGIGVHPKRRKDKLTYLYVPTPKQVEMERPKRPGVSDGRTFNILGGGAAGPGKSHGARWSMYRKALTLPGYEGLLLRKTFPELEKTHLRRMGRDYETFKQAGVACELVASQRIMKFRAKPDAPWSIIECGHMDDEAAVDKYLSSEYDDIVPDEASGFHPGALLELSTRARSSKPEVLAAGGPWFRPVTNPGGPASPMLRDFFIDHAPDFEKFPALRKFYDPALWVYVEATLEDNPYLGEGYEGTLAVLDEARYRQLRYGDWRVFAGQFFTSWRERKDGEPWHVQDLKLSADLEWFRSMDWGRSNPGCVLWWCCLPDGHLHLGAELKFVDTDVADVCQAMRAIDRELGIGHLRYTVSDPALHNRSQETGESIAETFGRNGIYLIRGNNNRMLGWERVRNLLRAAPDGQPWLSVSPRCRYLIRTLPALQQDSHNPEDLDTDMDDHAADALRYGAMSRPSPTRFDEPTLPAGAIGHDVAAIRELHADR